MTSFDGQLVSVPPAMNHAYAPLNVTGKYRCRCEDFIVVEQSLPPTHVGEHDHLLIEKRGCNTEWVARRLAEYAGVPPVAVGYAGRKDRHGVTTQAFTVRPSAAAQVDWSHFEASGFAIKALTKTQKKLRPGDHHGNRFDLVLREVTGDLSARLEKIASEGFPNYFGPQRFGHDGMNLMAVGSLFEGRRVPRRERSFLLSVARAQMFNEYLSRTLGAVGWEHVSATDVGPLYGRSRDPQLGESGLDERSRHWFLGLARFKVSASLRAMRVVPEALSWEKVSEGQWRLDFVLPPGSYATCLLRELCDVKEGEGGE